MVPSSPVDHGFTDVNLTLDNFDEILHAVFNADDLHVLPELTGESPVSAQSASDTSVRSINKDEGSAQQQIRLAREARLEASRTPVYY